MPRMKKRPAKAETNATAVSAPPGGDVLTLAEAAAYLRLPEQDVIDAALSQGLPGRLVGGEWRFLKPALQQWLGASQPTAEMRKAAQMAFAGAWKDDPMEKEYREELSRIRGRPMFEGLE